MSRRVATCAALAIASSCTTAAAADGAGDSIEDDGLGRAVLGARSPGFGGIVLHGSLGAALILPHITLGARAGLGGGFAVELGYRNLALFGQEGRFLLAWGTPLADGVDIGVAYRSSIATLEAADGGLIGIQFSTLPEGNDWEMGNDLVLSWNRPGSASITASLGPTFTLGGIRYVGYEQRAEGFTFDAAIRGIEAAVQGEWALWQATNFFLRLEALALLGMEKDEACVQAGQSHCGQLAPFGFIPTGTLGLAWALGGGA